MDKFRSEISEQAKALTDTFNYYINGAGSRTLEKLHLVWRSGKYKRIVFTGMGSSFFAPYNIVNLLQEQCIPSFIINASELLHYQFTLIDDRTLLVCISQSGESYEIVKLLSLLKKKENFIGITNKPDSSLGKAASVLLSTFAGEELMTSTKTYVSALLVLNLMAYALGGINADEYSPKITNMISEVQGILDSHSDWLQPILDYIGNPEFVQVTGRGPAFSSVQQTALMIMEASRKHASGLMGGEFRHGPIERVTNGFCCVIFNPEGKTSEQGIKLASDVARFGGKVILLSAKSVTGLHPNIYTIMINTLDESLFAIPSIIPMQFIVNEWALLQGIEPGDFARGEKVTKIE